MDVGIPLRDPHHEFWWRRIGITVAIFAVLAVADAVRRTRRSSRSVGGVVATMQARWPWRRLALAAIGLLAYHVVYLCYHNLKSWNDVRAVHDAFLTRVDQWLFFGHSPAVLLHDLLGQQLSAYVLIVIYQSFSYLVLFSFVAAVVLVDRLRDGFVFLAALIWTWVLGVGAYYLIPSIGPFDDRPQDFSGLPDTIVNETQAKYVAQREYLLAHPGASDAFAQLAAFASLHVAVAAVIMLMLRWYGRPWLFRLMAIYVGLTIVATVYLGWHFVVDDIAGLAIAALAVWLGRMTIYPRGRTSTPPASRQPHEE